MKDFSFEKALKKLEDIVQAIDKGDVDLDKAIKLYKQGEIIVKQCGDYLDKAKLKVKAVVEKSDGFTLQGFQSEEEEDVSLDFALEDEDDLTAHLDQETEELFSLDEEDIALDFEIDEENEVIEALEPEESKIESTQEEETESKEENSC